MSDPAPRRRVLIVVENLPVPFDRRVWSEATTLAEAGYEVSVICPTGKGFEARRETLEGVHIYRHPLPMEARSALGFVLEWGAALLAWMRLGFRVLRERGVDVIQGCNPPDLVFLLAWAMRPFGARYVFDHHDVGPEVYEAKFGRRGPLYWILRLFERLTFMTATVSIATNDSFAGIARSRGGMDPRDVFVVRSAPRIDKFQIRPPDPVHKKGFPFLIGYVGVIGEQEGMDLLVAAAEHLIRGLGREDAHFAIVGFGPALPDLVADVERRGLGRWFTFTGPLYGEALLSVLNTADLCVSPDPKNTMNDISTMNKVVEYMCLKKPLVQFDLKEGRASAGDAALYAEANDPVDFAEKIAWLLDHPEERARMGEIGRTRALEQLSWEHSAPRLLAAYERVFAKIGARAPAAPGGSAA